MNLQRQTKRALLSPKFEIECGIVIYICMPLICMILSIMQLLSFPFKCKINYLFDSYFRIFKPVLGLLFGHTLIILFHFFLILKFIRITLSLWEQLFFPIAKIPPQVFNKTAFLSSTCSDNLTCRSSDSHSILNNC